MVCMNQIDKMFATLIAINITVHCPYVGNSDNVVTTMQMHVRVPCTHL